MQPTFSFCIIFLEGGSPTTTTTTMVADQIRHRKYHQSSSGSGNSSRAKPESSYSSTADDSLDDRRPPRRWTPRRLLSSRGWIRPLLLLVVLLLLLPLKRFLFGNKKIHGGLIGGLVDSAIRTYTYRHTLNQRDQELAAAGYPHIPKLTQENINRRGLPVLTQTYLAEILLRSSKRRKLHKQAETHDKCHGIPKWILQPNSGDWYRPLLLHDNVEGVVVEGDDDEPHHQRMEFEESEMREFMSNHFPSLPDNNVPVWGLCAVYWYGGYFVGSQVRDLGEMKGMDPHLSHDSLSGDGSCTDKAVVIFHGSDIHVIKTTPRHPILACVIRKLEQMDHTHSVASSLFISGNPGVTPALAKGAWFESSCLDIDSCCELKESDKVSGSIYLQVTKGSQTTYSIDKYQRRQDDYRVVVQVNESNDPAPLKKQQKEPIGKILGAAFCEAGWLCNRCLKTSWYGTFTACSAFCRSCYINTICKNPDIPVRTKVHFDVVVKKQAPLSLAGHQRIPRIIHQTWFEEITPDRYPHLIRLQKSWKSSGWDYRFYTDETARQYIHSNFPSRFMEVFDALTPGAFKADFFRLLVLLRDGGIYADADVKLDVNIDSFVTPNLGFFVPRDFIAGYADGSYCFWNGLMGAEAGHPFLVKAIERMLNVVLNRADYYDIEREVCRSNPDFGSTEVWKLRSLDILTLTGPCALGISVNAALGRDNFVSKFDIGWLYQDGKDDFEDIGDVLVLVSDKYDMGEMRFTDIDRNLLVASTEHNMFTKIPFETPTSKLDHVEHHRGNSHYSSKEHVNDVFGSTGVYVDRMVSNEIYSLSTIRD